MSDGILKSNPDEIWNYFKNLNDSLIQMNEAVEELMQACYYLDDRLRKKLTEIQNKIQEYEKNIQDLQKLTMNNNASTSMESQIIEIKRKKSLLLEKEQDIQIALRRLPDYEKDVCDKQKEYQRVFSKGKRILNRYLKLVEIEMVKSEFKECEIKNSAGMFHTMQYRGTIFYCNNEGFDPCFVDDKGRTNIQRMQAGIAPLGYDGQSVELHHILQSENLGGIIELPGSSHREKHKALHINTSDIPTGINRNNFDVLRSAYWKKRAENFK